MIPFEWFYRKALELGRIAESERIKANALDGAKSPDIIKERLTPEFQLREAELCDPYGAKRIRRTLSAKPSDT